MSSIGSPSWDSLPAYHALPFQSNVCALDLLSSLLPLPTIWAYALVVSSILYLPWTCWFWPLAIVSFPSACEYSPDAVVLYPSACDSVPEAIVLQPSAWE